MIELAGMISLGKYTFVIRLEFPIKLLLASVRLVAKNCQGSRAAKTNNGYGALFSVGRLANLPKINVKIAIVRNGLKTAQVAPRAACL